MKGETKNIWIIKADAIYCPVTGELRLARECLKCDYYQGTNGNATMIKCKEV